MKNFRKVLALILVVATLFSFVAMASAKTSADYSDADKITYVEAVDVLSAIGILKGYNGAYHPTDDVGRDEMAKMIAVLRNGGVDNSALFTGANTFADVKGSWAEGYIAYAAQVGIVNGRNATTFDPEGKVTGTEVLKMLLCVLGYDAKLQGYVGSNWQVNVLRDATKMGLLDGLKDFDPYKAATRDESAQMMFNALKASMVYGYVSENIIKVTNSLYTFPDIISTPDAEKNGYEFAYCNAVLSNVPLWTIIKGLAIKNGTADCFGRPGHTWTYTVNNETVFSCFYADAYIAKQTEGDFDADLVADVIYVDGYETSETDGVISGNGVLVEYYDDVTVIINTYIAKVGTVNEYYNYFTLVDDADPAKVLAKFDLNDYDVKEGDVVLYHTCNGSLEGDAANKSATDARIILHDLKVITATTVDVAEGVNYKDWNASYIVASGKTYKYAALLGYVMDADKNMDRLVWNDIETEGASWDLYFDEYGFIKYLAPHTVATEYTYTYIVEGTLDVHEHGYTVDKEGNKVLSITRTADMVNYGTDGALTATADVTVAENVETALTDNGATYATGVLAKVYNDEGTTTIEAVGSFAPQGTELNKGSYVLMEDRIYATSQTVFMIRTKNLDGTYSYEQVTGYANLKGNYVARPLGDRTTNIQYFVNPDHPAFASYVFIDAVYTRDFATKFLTLGEADYYAFKTDLKELYAKDYVAYNALVAGEEAVVLVDIVMANDVIEPVKMYEAELSYIGVAITIDGKDLPIYCLTTEVPAIVDFVYDCVYTVVEGETYIRVGAHVYKVAEGGKLLTLTANLVDDEWVVDTYAGLLNLENGGKIAYAYMETNGDGEITSLIMIDSKYIEAV